MATTKKKVSTIKVLFYFSIVGFIVTVIFPFIWQFLMSIKPASEMYSMPVDWIPGKIILKRYVTIFTGRPFGRYLLNSLIVATGTTTFCLLVGSFAAYALARLEFTGKGPILALVLALSMFPPVAIVSPLYLMLKNVGLLNNYLGLILPYTTFAMPMTIWILTSFFRTIPFGLEEAAKIDGATPLQAFWKIIVPLAAPGTFTAAILIFIFAWNEYLFALTFMTSSLMKTVPVGLTMFPGQHRMPWGDIAAATVVVTVPLIIMVLFFQRRIISGLTAGAVKG
ncbi:ABC-type sugar transport system, permease component [Halobacteroides halobius DSM 5150]|uniref:ABC-type sugar transport system, permease component n=1 Tax=Halobacteroides halobius (strain ATCC 35273 / DSM 5150 / MD-1) TaxID=748449 RepID=L0KBM5_HALHC|nr:carbohydrate ABC transporter permease [Halobacteroides halobius]AGB41488.1 ABC-type sugar transport system, permease component [Halobacteroides halobius DSM 5150]